MYLGNEEKDTTETVSMGKLRSRGDSKNVADVTLQVGCDLKRGISGFLIDGRQFLIL